MVQPKYWLPTSGFWSSALALRTSSGKPLVSSSLLILMRALASLAGIQRPIPAPLIKRHDLRTSRSRLKSRLEVPGLERNAWTIATSPAIQGFAVGRATR